MEQDRESEDRSGGGASCGGSLNAAAESESGCEMERDGWLSVAQAAERLASSRRMVTRWAVSGKLGDVRPGQIGRGKGMRVSEKAVQAMVADRANELGKRVAREAQRKAILDQRQRDPALFPEDGALVTRRNLNWMLDLVHTLSDMADETLFQDVSSPAEARDTILDSITTIEDSLKRIRDRFLQGAGDEESEG